jgi:predicted DNA-binding transcriptional regulator AlpA
MKRPQAEEHPVLWRAKDAARAIGVHANTVWRLSRKPGFPKPRKISTRCTVWVRDEVVAWIDALTRGGPGGPTATA